MAKGHSDDFKSVRMVVATLEAFGADNQERMLRWAGEKLGLASAPQDQATSGMDAEGLH